MKSILLHIHEDIGQEARIDAALDLARAQSGHLNCVQIMPFSSFILGDPAASYVVTASLIQQAEEAAKALRERIEAHLAQEGVSWSWHYVTGDPAAVIVDRARFADVIVLTRATHIPEPMEPLPLVSDVALHARAPVLAVPPEGRSFRSSEPAMVAWNGSHEAANAMRASVPLLRTASACHVISVPEDAEPHPMVGVGDYLSMHGLSTALHERPRSEEGIGPAIVAAANELQAGVIVMGAYGHSRAIEFLLGGATRWMLAHSPYPLFLCH